MPVTPEEWDSGVAYTPLAKGLLSFLRENSPMGYSADELHHILGDIVRVHNLGVRQFQYYELQNVLDGLAADGQIESKNLEDETESKTYYRVTN